jgi:hypothetical protein
MQSCEAYGRAGEGTHSALAFGQPPATAGVWAMHMRATLAQVTGGSVVDT